MQLGNLNNHQKAFDRINHATPAQWSIGQSQKEKGIFLQIAMKVIQARKSIQASGKKQLEKVCIIYYHLLFKRGGYINIQETDTKGI